MRLHVLGTCSGTEPMPGRRHTSLVVEEAGGLYWLDAGESCGRTAHLMGLDLLSTRAIVISHPHIDHTGGLANLLFAIGKLWRLADPERRPEVRPIPVYLPDPALWPAASTLAGGLTDSLFTPAAISDGTLFEDGLTVIAQHNCHLGEPVRGEPWRSFSFRVEAAERALVYSGDVDHVSELAPLWPGACLLLMETGHHRVEEVCRYVAEHWPGEGRLALVHHGREILAAPSGALRLARGILGDRVTITDDRTTLDI